MQAIVVDELEKRYGNTTAVSGVSFTVDEGIVFALLGPNGAGKTTTVEILEGHRAPDAGNVAVLGFDPATDGAPFRDRIGIVLQETGIEMALTVREALDLYARYYSRARPAGELLEVVGLEEKADARIKTLSGGQRRRLDLALALVGDPDLLFLDEPTTGFDPAARRRAWQLVENLAQLGKTILLTTHYLDEAQQLADHIAVLSRGRIVAEGTPASLASGPLRATITFTLPEGVSVGDVPGVGSALTRRDRTIEITAGNLTSDVHTLTGWALAAGVDLSDLSVARPSLEDVYLDILDEGTP